MDLIGTKGCEVRRLAGRPGSSAQINPGSAEGPVGSRPTFQGLSASLRLPLPGVAQVRVEPAAETVLLVPGALSVANQNQLVGGHLHTGVLYETLPESSAEVSKRAVGSSRL